MSIRPSAAARPPADRRAFFTAAPFFAEAPCIESPMRRRRSAPEGRHPVPACLPPCVPVGASRRLAA